MKEYLANEINRWSCTKCGSTLCVHLDNCKTCGQPMNKTTVKQKWNSDDYRMAIEEWGKTHNR